MELDIIGSMADFHAFLLFHFGIVVSGKQMKQAREGLYLSFSYFYAKASRILRDGRYGKNSKSVAVSQ